MLKSNKILYPFKVKFPDNFDLDSLKADFSKSKIYGNIVAIPDREYSASLEFIKEEGGVIFFALNKFDNYNITVTDFDQQKDHPSYLKANQKIKNYSLFAIIKDSNMLILLFNHKGFGYVVPTLHKYLEAKLNVEFDAKSLTRKYSDADIKKYCKDIRHIHIVSQRENFKTFEKEEKGSSKKKIKKYMEKTEEIIKLQRIGSLSFDKVFKYIKDHMKKDYDKIIINSKNIGDVNILEDFCIHFPCKISVDKDCLANKDEFKEEILKIKNQEKTLFDRY